MRHFIGAALSARRRLLAFATIACAVVSSSTPQAQSQTQPATTAELPATAALPDEAAELLARRLTPGVIGLLVPYANRGEVAMRWFDALADPDPAVRRTAARAAFVTGQRAVVPALLRALAAETDEEAATEEVRAALMLGEATAIELVERAAARLKGGVAGRFVRLLATTQPAALLARAQTLRGFVPPEAMGEALATAMGATGDQTLAASEASMLPAEGFSLFLCRALEHRTPFSETWIELAKSRSADHVAAVAWAVAAHCASGESRCSVLASGLPLAAPASLEMTFNAYSVRLAAHVAKVGGAPAPGASGLSDEDRKKAALAVVRWNLSSALPGADKRALEKSLGSPLLPKTKDPETATLKRVSRTGGYPIGFEASLRTESACGVAASTVAGGIVSYNRFGTPTRVQIDMNGLPASCASTIQALVRMTLPWQETTESEHAIAVRPGKSVAVCEPEPMSSGRRIVGSKITPPKKIKDSPPVYQKLRRNRASRERFGSKDG